MTNGERIMNNNKRRVLCLCTALLMGASLYAADDEVNENDIQVLREWINTKRQVTVKELGGALSISGEVRTEFQRTREWRDGVSQRGIHGRCNLPKQAFDVEVNLMLDYRQDRTWAAIKLEFDNDAGVINGSFHKIKLERAYFGIRAVDEETYTIDVEFGRRRIGTILDSKLQFDSFFDGIFLRYDQELEKIGDVYGHVGTFVINEKQNHYGYLGEFGIQNAYNTGFYSKYSLIDWDTKKYKDKNHVLQRKFKFCVSQLIVGYRFQPATWGKAAIVYLAGLHNHAARKRSLTKNRRANNGGYIGFTLGELKKKNDWAVDANYQVLGAQAVPDFDVAGIGLGNACKTSFNNPRVTLLNPTQEELEKINHRERRRIGGNVNYRGFAVSLDYLLTNNLNIQQSWQQSISLFHHMGHFRHYNQYELELIYAF